MYSMTRSGSLGRITRPVGTALLLAGALALSGCGEQENLVLRVGSKDFTESKILAEMMARMAEAFTENTPTRLRAFRTLEEAEAWLSERPPV